MQHVAIADVGDNGATIPDDVLRALGAATGDAVAFVEGDGGTISLVKVSRKGSKRSIGDFAGIFSAGYQGSLEAELALLQDIRYGDEREGT